MGVPTLNPAHRTRVYRSSCALYLSYRSYWVYALLEILAKHRGSISVAELSDMTKFRTDDIVKTLQAFNLIRYFGGQHSIFVSPKTLETYYTKAKPNWIIDSTKVPRASGHLRKSWRIPVALCLCAFLIFARGIDVLR